MSIGSMVQRQWYERSDDEKFASLEDLHAHLLNRRSSSREQAVRMSDVRFDPAIGEQNGLKMYDMKTGVQVRPTNWAFQQTCAVVDAHPSYLSKLPAHLVSQCLNYGFEAQSKIKNRELAFFLRENGQNELLALTGGYYGRVWDSTVALAALEIQNKLPKFYSPLDWGKEKRALFSSDRDLTMLFIDGGSIVDGGMTAKGEPEALHRGMLWWNSDVGAGALKFYTFLFRWVCGNFGIHGIEEVQFTKIRHTINAPTRFVSDMMPQIEAYLKASPKRLEETIRKAKVFPLPKDSRKFDEYFQHRKFTKVEIATAEKFADTEEGGHETLWQMYNGFTASARVLKFADKATDLQRRAGRLLEQLAA